MEKLCQQAQATTQRGTYAQVLLVFVRLQRHGGRESDGAAAMQRPSQEIAKQQRHK
jgi:hypothetical protein